MKENIESVCFVGKIQEINNIEGADRIQQAIISNWECVIPKDKYKIGDLVVIAVTDAIIPLELAQNLGVENYLKNRKKTGQLTVKTTKLKGVYSSAMIIASPYDYVKSVKEGDDCMKFFNIEKYEEPAELIQLSNGKKVRWHKNPLFHVYHKFPNAKNAPDMFSEEDDVIYTRKIHGTNARYGIVKKNKLSILDRVKKFFGNKWVGYEYVYGSHNVEKGSDTNGFYSTDVWKTVAEKYKIREKLWSFVKDPRGGLELGEGIILYGEIYGPGIQKYYEYSEKELKIKFFDIKLNGEYLSHEDFSYMLSGFLFEPCDILYQGKFNKELIPTFFTNIPNTKVPEEGVVVSHISGSREKITKFVSPSYLEFQSKKEDSTDFH